jgi:hypothetical protein
VWPAMNPWGFVWAPCNQSVSGHVNFATLHILSHTEASLYLWYSLGHKHDVLVRLNVDRVAVSG